MNPMMLAALSMDPKTLQAMGIDPKKLNALAQPATSKSGDSKTKANSTLDPMLLAAFGMDPKNPKLDPITAAALGLDPKNPKFDPMLLASLGLDPKNPNSTILAAMAAMDPNHQLAVMYGMMPPGFPGMPGRDMFNKGGKASSTAKDTKSPHPAPSPRGFSQRDGPSPRTPSRESASSRDGRDNKDKGQHQADLLLFQWLIWKMNPALFGLKRKMLAILTFLLEYAFQNFIDSCFN